MIIHRLILNHDIASVVKLSTACCGDIRVVLDCRVAVSLLICGVVILTTVSVSIVSTCAFMLIVKSGSTKKLEGWSYLKGSIICSSEQNSARHNRIYNNLLEKVSVVSPWLVFSWQDNTFIFFKWAIKLNWKASMVNSSRPFVMKNSAQNATSVEKGANKITLIVLYLADKHSNTHLLSVWATIQVYYWYNKILKPCWKFFKPEAEIWVRESHYIVENLTKFYVRISVSGVWTGETVT